MEDHEQPKHIYILEKTEALLVQISKTNLNRGSFISEDSFLSPYPNSGKALTVNALTRIKVF